MYLKSYEIYLKSCKTYLKPYKTFVKQYKMYLNLYKPYFNAFKCIKMCVNAYISLYGWLRFLCDGRPSVWVHIAHLCPDIAQPAPGHHNGPGKNINYR